MNTAAGNDLVINEDAITRNGSIAINTGAANTLSTNGNFSASGDATLGTATSTTGGSLILHDNNAVSTFTGTLQGASAYTADRTYTLPDADGTFAVITGTLNNTAFLYTNGTGNVATTAAATDGQLLIGNSAGNPTAATLTVERGLAIVNGNGSITLRMPAGTTTNATLRWDGTNWVTTGSTYGIDANGNPTLGTGGQAAASSLTFNDGNAGDNFTVTLVSPSVLTSNVTVTLPTASGTILTSGSGWATTGNGHTVTDGTNNLIGTTTAAAIRLITNSTTRLTISSAGAFTFAGTAGTPNTTIANLGGTAKVSVPVGYDRIVLANNAGSLDEASISTVLGGSLVLYGATSAQTAAIADGANYLFNVNYSGVATGNALGAVISSDATGGTDASATGLTVNAIATGVGVASGIIVNTGAGNDLTINEDSFTRDGSIAINPGAGNRLTSDGLGMSMGTGTQTTAGFLTLNDATGGTPNTGTIQKATNYTANRTYTLPDADGALAVITGTLNNNAFVYTNTSGAMSTTASATNGQILIGSTGVAPVVATLTGSRGIAITNGAGSITVAMPTGASDAVLRFDGTNWVNSGTAFTVTSGGDVAAAGDATLGTATSTTGGSLILHDNNTTSTFTGSLQGAAEFTADRTYTLPDADGTFAVIAGTMNSNAFVYANNAGALATTAAATDGQLLIGKTGSAPVAATLTGSRGIAITNGSGAITIAMPSGTTAGATLIWDSGTSSWVTTGSTYQISSTGNPTIGSDANTAASTITFNDGVASNTFALTLTAPATLTSNVTVTLPTTSGTILTTGSGYANGGNAFGAAATVGLTDNFGLDILTNNVSRIGIAAGGAITLSNLSGVTTGSALGTDEGLVIASSTGVLSKRSIASVVGSKTVAGTADGQLAIWNNTTTQYEPVAVANLSIGTSGSITSAASGSFAGDVTVGSGTSASGGSLIFNDDNTGTSVTGSIVGAASFTATRTFTLPDASGTFALTSGALTANTYVYSNASGVITSTVGTSGDGKLLIGNGSGAPVAALPTGTRGISITGGAGTLDIALPAGGATNGVMRYNGTDWVSTGSTFGIDASGNPTLGIGTQGTASSMIFHDGASGTARTVTLIAPTSLAGNIIATLPTSSGTIVTSGNGYINGGNSFGADATIGLTDGFALDLITSGTSRMSIDAAGSVSVSSLSGAPSITTLGVNDGIVVATSTGVVSKRTLAAVVGSKTVAGTTDGQVAVWNNTTLQYEPVSITTFGVNATSGSVNAAKDLTLGVATSVLGGSLILHDNDNVSTFTGTLQGAALFTANRTITMPDASGTLMLSSGALTGNSMIYSNATGVVTSTSAATDGQILIGNTGSAPTLGSVTGANGLSVSYTGGNIQVSMPAGTTTGATLRWTGSAWATTSTTYGIDANGNPTLGTGGQSAASTLSFNDGNTGDNFTVTLASPSVLTSNVTITLPTTSGTMLTTGSGWATTGNGHTVTDGTNNLIGTTTAAAIRLITNSTTRLTISSGGDFTFAGTNGTANVTMTSLGGSTTGSALTSNEGLVIADANGALTKRSLANIVGSKTVAGTANNQVPIWNNTNGQYEPVSASNYTLDASGNVVNGGTLNVNGATTLGNGDAGDVVTVNNGGAADLSIAETGITRVGNIAVNPGTGNTLSTDGNLTVAGTTTANGKVILGNQTSSATDANVAPTITTAFLEVSITNTDGTANNVTLPSGTNGQVLYMRLSVTNTAGTSDVTLVNNDASVIDTYAQGANYQRVLHMIYVSNSSKWVVLSNVQP